jgi:DMSO reductase anchor subunit
MHPAFSVIFFTTISGAGLGLWAWLGLRIAFGGSPEVFEPIGWAWGLIIGAVLTAAGLASSFLHLGKPLRAWRAFSQWRSSWLSREGVLAVLCFAAAAHVLVAGHFGVTTPWIRVAAALLAVLALATVYSTAMIYASLTPVPAWCHRLVVPVYLGFALLAGLLLLPMFAHPRVPADMLAGAALLLAFTLWALKHRYWRDLDAAPAPATTGAAVGLPGREVGTFEHPHTDANYLTREMGFVLARKHSARLRRIARLLFGELPVGLLLAQLALLPDATTAMVMLACAVSVLAGTFVERWLFFAEARHIVSAYYARA